MSEYFDGDEVGTVRTFRVNRSSNMNPVVFDPSVSLGEVRIVERSATDRPKDPVPFDASNVDHRQWYLNFITNSRWDSNAPRFIVEAPHLTVPTMISAKLLDFYMASDKKLSKSSKLQ